MPNIEQNKSNSTY